MAIVSDEEIEKWVSRSREISLKYSQAVMEKTRCEEERKVVKSTLMREFDMASIRKTGKSLSASVQERDAYADPRYIQVVERLATACQAEAYWRIEMKAFDIQYNVWRTQQANERAQFHAYNN